MEVEYKLLHLCPCFNFENLQQRLDNVSPSVYSRAETYEKRKSFTNWTLRIEKSHPGQNHTRNLSDCSVRHSDFLAILYLCTPRFKQTTDELGF